jgi:hypothetical protein
LIKEIEENRLRIFLLFESDQLVGQKGKIRKLKTRGETFRQIKLKRTFALLASPCSAKLK